MTDIYCDEPVIATYRGTREYDDLDGANSYLDCYHGITYHVTEGERIVLETEHFYISLEACGVTKSPKTCGIKEFEYPGEWLDPHIHSFDTEEIPWVDYESTLFVGERLLRYVLVVVQEFFYWTLYRTIWSGVNNAKNLLGRR